ncbi:MAG: hypothetical protein RLZ44_436 [Pseudomonadota bacterium]|jgi:TRAP transporter TAXI family solute receptor
MRRCSWLAGAVWSLFGLGIAPGALAAGAADGADPPTTVLLGTSTPGGGFELFGQSLAEVINGSEPRLRVTGLATRGSSHNLALLEAGEIDLGLVEGNAARRALDGVDRAPAALRVLAVMYPNPGMFAVRGDSSDRTIEDLRGKPVVFGTRASGLRILLNDVIDGLGLSAEQDFQAIILEKAADGPRLVQTGEAQALWGAGIGWPGFVRLADGPAGARFIAPSAAQIQAILERHPHLRRMSVPAGTYQGQTERIDSVGLWSLILVRPDLSEATAYRLAQAIHGGAQLLASRLPQGRYTTAENTVAEVPEERLHPGAARYYRDAGLLP